MAGRRGSVPEENGCLARLDPPGLVEERREVDDDRAGVAPVLGKVLAETRISPVCACSAARYWASSGMKSLKLRVTSARPAAVARERTWSWQALGEHHIEQQRGTQRSPGEQLVFSAPRLLSCVLGRTGRGYLRVDLVAVGAPIPDGCADEAQRDPGVVGD